MVAIKAMVDQLSSGATTQPSAPPATPTLAAPTGVTTSNASSSGMQIKWSGVTFNDIGLAAATQYSWTVKAVDANSVESPASAAATGTTTGTAPPPVTCFTATNYAHTTAGRAYTASGYAYANGSKQNMGLWNTCVITTLKNTAANYYVISTCP